MGIKTVVDGLEMFAIGRGPGAAKCDGCGAILSSTRDQLFDDMDRAGWTYEGRAIGAPCRCPSCSVTPESRRDLCPPETP